MVTSGVAVVDEEQLDRRPPSPPRSASPSRFMLTLARVVRRGREPRQRASRGPTPRVAHRVAAAAHAELAGRPRAAPGRRPPREPPLRLRSRPQPQRIAAGVESRVELREPLEVGGRRRRLPPPRARSSTRSARRRSSSAPVACSRQKRPRRPSRSRRASGCTARATTRSRARDAPPGADPPARRAGSAAGRRRRASRRDAAPPARREPGGCPRPRD